MRNAHIAGLAAIAWLSAGCLRMEAKGPTTLVHFAPAAGETRIFDVTMDGEPLLYGGVEITVPAGAHDFRLRFEKESRVCSADEPFCNLVRRSGRCRLLADTKAGKLYQATLAETGDQFFLSLVDTANRTEDVAKAECHLTGAETRIEVTR